MILRDKHEINEIKATLLEQLKADDAFWSFNPRSILIENIDDDQLIAMTMRYLDIREISMLFKIYPYRKIKDAWKRILVPEGEYLYSLNRFFAWYYFRAKRPDSYLKSIETRNLNSFIPPK